MSQQETDPTQYGGSLDYPPLLNLVMPVIILGVSAAYAWSLRGVTNPDMNLLLLKPIFLVIWILLAIVVITDVIPSIGQHRIWARTVSSLPRKSWSAFFAPRSETAAGVVVAATLVFSFFGPGRGPVTYLASLFIYLCVAGYLIGDRGLPRLVIGAALCSAGLYVVMGLLLGVRL